MYFTKENKARFSARLLWACCAATGLLLGAAQVSIAQAQTTQERRLGPTLRLDASASQKVPHDEMVVYLSVERDGSDIGALNQSVLSVLRQAIDEAGKVKDIQAKLGSLTTFPNYTPQGRHSGWKVRGEAIMTSTNLPALGKLAGELSQRMQITGVQFRLSESARKKAESQLIGEAASAFRSKAEQATKALGFKQFTIRETSLHSGRQGLIEHRGVEMMQMAKARAAGPPEVPTEGGDSEVVVSFSGVIEMMQ